MNQKSIVELNFLHRSCTHTTKTTNIHHDIQAVYAYSLCSLITIIPPWQHQSLFALPSVIRRALFGLWGEEEEFHFTIQKQIPHKRFIIYPLHCIHWAAISPSAAAINHRLTENKGKAYSFFLSIFLFGILLCLTRYMLTFFYLSI